MEKLKFNHGSLDVNDSKDNFGVYITQGNSCISVFNDKHQGTCICIYDNINESLPAIAFSKEGIQFRDTAGEPVILNVSDVTKLKKLLESLK